MTVPYARVSPLEATTVLVPPIPGTIYASCLTCRGTAVVCRHRNRAGTLLEHRDPDCPPDLPLPPGRTIDDYRWCGTGNPDQPSRWRTHRSADHLLDELDA